MKLNSTKLALTTGLSFAIISVAAVAEKLDFVLHRNELDIYHSAFIIYYLAINNQPLII